MRTTDTIAAVATPLSPAGIGIIRITGSDAVEIADKVYRGKNKLSECETHTINYGHIYDGETIVDQVLVMLMRAPRTYTGEDSVEIDCHGGVLVLQKVLSLVLKAGAVLAEPGEFTKRAFLNGKLDLTQAEAIVDVIDANNNYVLNNGVKQLKGRLSEKIRNLRSNLLEDIAYIEAALDDPEHYDLTGYPVVLQKKVREYIDTIDGLLKYADEGIILKNGISTVILGRPNAGKSSIYNLLTKSDRAIVTDVAGTTRDTLTENIRLSGISLNITDTAGVHESDDTVEKIGIDRAKQAAETADLVLCIIDSSDVLRSEDIEILKMVKDKRVIILLNKSDLDEVTNEENIRQYSDKTVIKFSAKDSTGLSELEDSIKALFYGGLLSDNGTAFITSQRHRDAFERSRSALCQVLDSIDNDLPEDFFSIDLTEAYEDLGEITGETLDDDIINEIFSKFCMGK